MVLKSKAKNVINKILNPLGLAIVKERETRDFILHEYNSYEEYRDIQIFHNKRKLDRVWADERTLDRVVAVIFETFGQDSPVRGLCHGTRNGFEQNYLRSVSSKFDVIGTDISETAAEYENSVQWDFHDENSEWEGQFDFVYTNSLDQSWKPKSALLRWLSQLNDNGILIIEHSVLHGPVGASEMDPFGVRPTAMPYVLTMWFGSQISIEHSVAKKENNKLDAWLFVIRKNVPEVMDVSLKRSVKPELWLK